MLEATRDNRLDFTAVHIHATYVVEGDEHAARMQVGLACPRLELVGEPVIPAEVAKVHRPLVYR
jgi:hypothetical protein